MQQELAARLKIIIQDKFGTEISPVLTRPDAQFGDFATNAAMQLAGKLSRPPREIGQILASELQGADSVVKAEVAGPGFVNITLSDTPYLQEMLAILSQKNSYGTTDALAGKTVVAEYSDPNPFKVLHAGHLYTSVVGDAIANLLETAGAAVHRVNFGGDVGLHVGKTMWAVIRELGGEYPQKLAAVPHGERAPWMTARYVEGTNAYEDDPAAKEQITAYNKQVYALHTAADRDTPFAQIYWICRQWSYDYFDEFYARIGTKFEKYYPESSVADLGLQTVREQLAAGVFEESEGAVIFDGEKHGLHTRVFINREGLPTYEAKDVGLIMAKKRDYNFDKSVVITGSEQEQYMAVVLKAVEQFAPDLVQATAHLTHGLVKLQGGAKMSSRKGNILRAVDVLEAAAAASREATGAADDTVVLGAVKYAFLRQRTGGDIWYDPAESVSIEGNSGPYLQYAHARARSILRKAAEAQSEPPESADEISEDRTLNHPNTFEPGERTLVRKLSEYPDAVQNAMQELMPHHIATYLYELAQTFNRFYEKNRVIGDEREPIRLQLVEAYAQILHNGLSVLGIHAPSKM